MEHPRRDLLYLTGFMGCGKSSVGPILANTLGYDAIDIDTEIERSVGKRISEIFFERGEQYFRDLEYALLQKVSQQHGYIVSLGGGTIADQRNLGIIKSTGVLVYLKLDADHIFRRLKFKKNRPLLIKSDGTTLSDDELRARINTLLADREPFYNQSDVIIVTNEMRIGLTVDEIVRRTKLLIA